MVVLNHEIFSNQPYSILCIIVKPARAGLKGEAQIGSSCMKLQIPGTAIDCCCTTFCKFGLFAQWGLAEALQRKQSNASILNHVHYSYLKEKVNSRSSIK